MISESDVRALRYAHSVFNRRGIDITRADVRMMHGILHVRGTLSKAVGSNFTDLRSEVEHVVKVLKSRPEVREVCMDVSYLNL